MAGGSRLSLPQPQMYERFFFGRSDRPLLSKSLRLTELIPRCFGRRTAGTSVSFRGQDSKRSMLGAVPLKMCATYRAEPYRPRGILMESLSSVPVADYIAFLLLEENPQRSLHLMQPRRKSSICCPIFCRMGIITFI